MNTAVNPARVEAHRQRVKASQARAEADRRAKRDSEALVATGLTVLITIIAVYDLILLGVGLR